MIGRHAVDRFITTTRPIEVLCDSSPQVYGYGLPVLRYQTWTLQVKWIVVLFPLHVLTEHAALTSIRGLNQSIECVHYFFNLHNSLFFQTNFSLVRRKPRLTSQLLTLFLPLLYSWCLSVSIGLSPPPAFHTSNSPSETCSLWFKIRFLSFNH